MRYVVEFFIARPIFAWVLSICIMALGTISILTLPIEQYPDIAPPGVNVTANYPGASAKTVEDSVTQILEQQIKGIDGLLYFSSSSSSAGQARISLSFNQKQTRILLKFRSKMQSIRRLADYRKKCSSKV